MSNLADQLDTILTRLLALEIIVSQLSKEKPKDEEIERLLYDKSKKLWPETK